MIIYRAIKGLLVFIYQGAVKQSTAVFSSGRQCVKDQKTEVHVKERGLMPLHVQMGLNTRTNAAVPGS